MKIVALIFTALLFLSCRKMDEPSSGPEPTGYELITTGILFNSHTKTYQAYYWKGWERVRLPSEGSSQAYPYGLDRTEKELCIAGSYTAIDPQSGMEILKPCYWVNGIKKNLPVDNFSFSERCTASDVKWFNGAWYILGDYDLKPVIWKVKGTTIEVIILAPLDVSAVQFRKTSNLELYKNKLYIGGNRKKIKDDQFVYDTGYWVVNSNDEVDYQVLEDNLAYALSFYILPTQLAVYVSGEYSHLPGTSKPVIWTSRGKIAYLENLHPAYNRVRTMAMNNKNELFAALHNIQIYQPVVHKIQQNGTHDELLPFVPASARGLVATLAVSNDQVAFSYVYELYGRHYAELVFNNHKQELNIDNSAGTRFHRTAIFKK